MSGASGRLEASLAPCTAQTTRTAGRRGASCTTGMAGAVGLAMSAVMPSPWRASCSRARLGRMVRGGGRCGRGSLATDGARRLGMEHPCRRKGIGRRRRNRWSSRRRSGRTRGRSLRCGRRRRLWCPMGGLGGGSWPAESTTRASLLSTSPAASVAMSSTRLGPASAGCPVPWLGAVGVVAGAAVLGF